MTFTINDFFIDSSVLIEYNKGNKVKLFSDLQANYSFRCFVNETVVSEFLFYFLAHNSNKAPQTIQVNNQIASVFASSNQYKLIKLCHFIPNSKRLFYLVPELMSKYNLLPNDAIILATCKIHGIKNLVSLDSDFIIPCREEGIDLLIEE